MLSYAQGVSPQPLLGETIGDNLHRTIARVPDAEALVSYRQGARYTYAEFGEAVDRLAGGLLAAGLSKGERVGVWSPNRAEWALIQYATARAGVILVNINPAYRTSELEYALAQSGCRWIFATQQLKDADFVDMVDHVRPRPAGARASDLLRHAGLGRGRLGLRLHRRSPRPCARARLRRSDQHPVHERHHRLPQGGDAHPPQHPQQRLLRRPDARIQRARPGVHPGAAVPLLRHGAGEPGRDLARRVHGVSR